MKFSNLISSYIDRFEGLSGRVRSEVLERSRREFLAFLREVSDSDGYRMFKETQIESFLSECAKMYNLLLEDIKPDMVKSSDDDTESSDNDTDASGESFSSLDEDIRRLMTDIRRFLELKGVNEFVYRDNCVLGGVHRREIIILGDSTFTFYLVDDITGERFYIADRMAYRDMNVEIYNGLRGRFIQILNVWLKFCSIKAV